MISDIATVKELIEQSAKSVNASPKFVESVLELFRSKGISLESRAEPYGEMIRRAFSSHGEHRAAFSKIQEELQELNQTLLRLQRAWLNLAEKTREIEETLRRRQSEARRAYEEKARAQQELQAKQERKSSPGVLLLRPKLLPN